MTQYFVPTITDSTTRVTERISLDMALDIGMRRFRLLSREKDVMRAVLANPDMTLKEIAYLLCIQPSTVKNRLTRILVKTDRRSTQGALLLLIQTGMGEAS